MNYKQLILSKGRNLKFKATKHTWMKHTFHSNEYIIDCRLCTPFEGEFLIVERLDLKSLNKQKIKIDFEKVNIIGNGSGYANLICNLLGDTIEIICLNVMSEELTGNLILSYGYYFKININTLQSQTFNLLEEQIYCRIYRQLKDEISSYMFLVEDVDDISQLGLEKINWSHINIKDIMFDIAENRKDLMFLSHQIFNIHKFNNDFTFEECAKLILNNEHFLEINNKVYVKNLISGENFLIRISPQVFKYGYYRGGYLNNNILSLWFDFEQTYLNDDEEDNEYYYNYQYDCENSFLDDRRGIVWEYIVDITSGVNKSKRARS